MKLSTLTSGSLVGLALLAGVGSAHAGDTVYRCGNEYLNDAQEAKRRGCKVMEGGNLTVIEGTSPRSSSSSSSSSSSRRSPASAPKVSSSEQKKRDSDAKAILDKELASAQERLEKAKQEYANGEPEKVGPEHRNHQMYLDRVEQLKQRVERAESDVSSIQRELDRLN
ncbi:hypothetical protein [Hydrogenophaga sp. 5NK40-0174]|uniref:hypothetical protein n=1 Tax=Hydrogenophaga sp. 5NK40-0174 TaxID=3127649 RepID=UPI00310B9118